MMVIKVFVIKVILVIVSNSSYMLFVMFIVFYMVKILCMSNIRWIKVVLIIFINNIFLCYISMFLKFILDKILRFDFFNFLNVEKILLYRLNMFFMFVKNMVNICFCVVNELIFVFFLLLIVSFFNNWEWYWGLLFG